MNISNYLYSMDAYLYVVFKNIYIFKNQTTETSTISSQIRSPGRYLITVKNKPPS